MIDEKGKQLHNLMREALLFKSAHAFDTALKEFDDYMNELNGTTEMRYNANGERIGLI